MYKVTNIRYNVKKDVKITDELLLTFAVEKIKKDYKVNPINPELFKKSLDARHPNLYYELSVIFDLKENVKINDQNFSIYNKEEDPELKELISSNDFRKHHIAIVGMGPAGIFAGYSLALGGYSVTILEQGANVDERTKDIDEFQNGGKLNTFSNIHFGEGGAGTFSDGKLQTGITSPYIRFIFETFVRFGASKNILYETLPHIGTDVLKRVIKGMRESLINMNVEVLFHEEVVDFNDQEVISINTKTLEKRITSYDKLIIAGGHSGKKLYEILRDNKHNIEMKPKSFSVGMRIEHLQKDINKALYHGDYPYLPACNYKLVSHLKNGRSCYSFCMCPGGYVVNAASSTESIVTNGMSYQARDGINSNAAILVNVTPEDYYHGDIFDGIKYQEAIEKKAWDYVLNKQKGLATHQAPVSTLDSFMKHETPSSIGNIQPTIKPGYVLSNMWDILPEYVNNAIVESIPFFDKKIPGFSNPNSILTAPETRTSSAVTIVRNPDTMENNIPNVYVIGEGSGYSGGITTSAVDGVKVAIQINKKYKIGD